MAKDTFERLPEDKKEKILSVLKKNFEEKPFNLVTVKDIVDELGIARGSFYQYFESLEDAYFEILDRKTTDIHKLFLEEMKKDTTLEEKLTRYGKALQKALFNDNYSIYKTRYLYWDEGLNKEMRARHKNTLPKEEKVQYLKGILHTLIQRTFEEEWTKEEFLEKYETQLQWILKGVN
ncbi:TetR/AcrR family transcriptional regulator [Guggenheimella bovis]